MTIPRIRLSVKDWEGELLVAQDGLEFCFYMQQSHDTLRAGVRQALDLYLKVMGKESLNSAPDSDGYWQPLDAAAWSAIHQKLHNPLWASVALAGQDRTGDRFGFEYRGHAFSHPDDFRGPDAVSALRVSFPTKILEAHGPERIRGWALEMAQPLPFSYGHAGLCFNGYPTASTVRDEAKRLAFRHPAMDVINLDDVARDLGTHVRAPAWMNFLGPPVLNELGGTDALRSRLHSPGTTVQAIGQDRAVVTLGPYPEAGDTEQGQTLPAYRELARVLEPWLYQTSGPEDSDLFDSTRRWQRRFLD
ncbi:DUF3396 domain-containing protein [Corallococcus carmarthensis]|uniref:DUF3396 domain-containing protein n=1 Tax=Corallococcus carmarthensis TaxID=2316728 RepID=A0A3A8KKC1_9BACT|nr:DUF3396 domain-containing protein [Corallococcus carmarthensis]NOK17440.1 DUF3396 domain-containing protein [Corallococcus carmarthensis]RKH04671.1 DUF3396 domain-containing protein [Corallococcus carmarthensis]